MVGYGYENEMVGNGMVGCYCAKNSKIGDIKLIQKFLFLLSTRQDQS